MQESQYARFIQTLNGEKPQRRAFITRLETWYKSHSRSGTLPGRFAGMSLEQVHKAVSVGQLKFMAAYALRLRKVEVYATLNGEPLYHQYEPEIENFPGMWDYVSNTQAGETLTELRTPVGSLRLRHAMLEEGVFNATEPYLQLHPVQSENDLQVVEFIIEQAELVPRYTQILAEQARLGADAVVVPLLQRIPFQQMLLEYLGEAPLFYWLHDQPALVERLHSCLNHQMETILAELAGYPWPYVEFPDNLHGLMTNPRLFRRFCLPVFQEYCSRLHAQGKKVGSHTDGDIQPLLGLLAESGLDVCESVSPYPLTACPFSEIWQAWQNGPLIWGGIPSPLLETSTSDEQFHAAIDRLFATIGEQNILLGVVDLFMRHNSIERVASIARRIEDQVINTETQSPALDRTIPGRE